MNDSIDDCFSIGTVSCPSGVLFIADPCYGGDPDRGVRVSVPAGDYDVFAHRDDTGFVMGLTIPIEEFDADVEFETVLLGDFEVDSGTVGIEDIDLTETMLEALSSPTGWGDGCYPVLAQMAHGRIMGLVIDFDLSLDYSELAA